MAPGLCASKIPELESCGLCEGIKACVRIAGNPLPFAVGDSAISWATLSSGQRPKGKALVVHHVYGDLLAGGKMVPNSGFGPSRIYPVEDESAQKEAAADDVYDSGSDSESESTGEESGDGDDKGHKGGDDESAAETDEQGGVDGEGPDPVAKTLEDEDAAAAAAAAEEGEGVIGGAEEYGAGPGVVNGAAQQLDRVVQQGVQDEALLQAVLLASKYIVKDKQLPMLVSTYWTILQRYCLTILYATVVT